MVWRSWLWCWLQQLSFRAWREVGYMASAKWVAIDWWWDNGYTLAHDCMGFAFPVAWDERQSECCKGAMSVSVSDSGSRRIGCEYVGEIISAIVVMQKVVEVIREFVQSQWTLGEVHGICHWDRVYQNGKKLLAPDINPLVVALFAYLHDSCRMNDGEDIDHGKRAAYFIDTIRDSYLKKSKESTHCYIQWMPLS